MGNYNTLIGFGNYIDTSILSNGSWITTLPLKNLQNRQLARVARTSSADPAGTKVDIDIGTGNIVRVFSAMNHNFDLFAQYRLRGSNDPFFSIYDYDSGTVDVWPSVYNSLDLDWESDNFWLGKYLQQDITGYPWHLIVLTGSPKYLRYWRFEVFDASNSAGYIQIGRLFIGDAWQPENGINLNADIGWEDPTTSQTSLSSSKYFYPKAPYRVAHCETHFMGDDEAFAKAFEIQRRSGNWKELVYIHDTTDTVHAIRRRFPGRNRVIDPVKFPYQDFRDTSWEIEEITP